MIDGASLASVRGQGRRSAARGASSASCWRCASSSGGERALRCAVSAGAGVAGLRRRDPSRGASLAEVGRRGVAVGAVLAAGASAARRARARSPASPRRYGRLPRLATAGLGRFFFGFFGCASLALVAARSPPRAGRHRATQRRSPRRSAQARRRATRCRHRRRRRCARCARVRRAHRRAAAFAAAPALAGHSRRGCAARRTTRAIAAIPSSSGMMIRAGPLGLTIDESSGPGSSGGSDGRDCAASDMPLWSGCACWRLHAERRSRGDRIEPRRRSGAHRGRRESRHLRRRRRAWRRRREVALVRRRTRRRGRHVRGRRRGRHRERRLGACCGGAGGKPGSVVTAGEPAAGRGASYSGGITIAAIGRVKRHVHFDRLHHRCSAELARRASPPIESAGS